MIEETPTASLASRTLPWLLLLPLFVLAWPSPSPIAGDFATIEITALGLGTLALLPLGLWLVWQRPRPVRASVLLFLALLVPVNFASPTDTLELHRAILTFLLAVLVASAGSCLDAWGRAGLTRALACLSILLTVPALLDGTSGWGGVLGNSGELSGAALPGALCGLVLWANGAPRWQWVGMTATGLFLLQAMFAPVIAGLVVLGLAALVVLIYVGKADAGFRSKLLTTTLLAWGAIGYVKWTTPAPATEAETTAIVQEQAPPTAFGGFEVRRRLWLATFDMFRDNALIGVGAGQFAARFPEYRDAREQQLSNWDHRIEATTEVENPHSDWLLPWAEGGIFAGIAWWAFLLLVLRVCLRAMRRGEDSATALGAAGLGGLLAAGINAPLLYNPLASIALFTVFGVLMEGGGQRPTALVARPSRFAPLLMPGLVLLLMMYVPRAANMFGHGLALARKASSTTATEQAEAINDAASRLGDSVVALTLQARLLEQESGDLEGALANWDRVLKLRPLRFEAWMQRGVLLGRLHQLDDARDAFSRAFELDPRHPGLLRNRARLEAESGNTDGALAEVERLAELERFSPSWLQNLACEQILLGRMELGQVLLARADFRFKDLIGEQALVLEDEYRLAGNAMAADSFRVLAQWLWAQAQAASGDWGDARRSYFQALRIQRDYRKPAGPESTRVEHACALWLDGKRARARESIEDVDLGALNWADFPKWCRSALYGMAPRGAVDGE